MAWSDEVQFMRDRLGREPTLDELLERAKTYTMTPDEIQAQRESFARGMRPIGDPRFD